jgi:hypothetical protein
MSIVFLGVEIALIALALLMFVSNGFGRLESSIGIMSDGIVIGKAAPAWNLLDLQGVLQRTPTHDNWQFLIFADRALGSFPLAVAGIHALSVEDNLQVLVMSRDNEEISTAVARGLNLRVPVVSVEHAFYERFRVRVMPFAFLIDPSGIVRWTDLAISEEQMRHVWHLTRKVEHEIEMIRE